MNQLALDVDATDALDMDHAAAVLAQEDADARPAPTCRCEPHGLHVADDDGAGCWTCGRAVA